MGDLVLGLAAVLLPLDFSEAFVGAFDVANKVCASAAVAVVLWPARGPLHCQWVLCQARWVPGATGLCLTVPCAPAGG